MKTRFGSEGEGAGSSEPVDAFPIPPFERFGFIEV